MQDHFRSQHPQRHRRPWPAPGHWRGAHLLLALLFLISGSPFLFTPHPAAAQTTFTCVNKTTANGLGSNSVRGVYASGSTIYAATSGGLSISTDGGATFTNKIKSNSGLGNSLVFGVYASDSTIYAATDSGLSISTDGGATFTNYTSANGLGGNTVRGVYANGSTIFAATSGGLSISTDGGATFTNYTSANGLGSNGVRGIYASGSTVYAATNGGLSISTDGGATFTNYTTANGLGSSTVVGVYASGSTIYAATAGGLSISTDGGASYTNYTTANGLGSNTVNGVYASGSTIYAATSGGLSISTDSGANFTNYTTANNLGSNTVVGVYASGSTVYAATNVGLSICSPSSAAPEIDVQGNSVSILNGDSTPAAADHTDFGRLDANGGSVVRTFTISNSGTGALTLSGSPFVSVTGNSAFTVSSQPASSSVAAGGSTTFQVTFAPSAAGVVTATVSIANNDSDETPYTFVVQGIRTGGNVALGKPASQSSITGGACAVAASAVDGNTSGAWGDCTVSHTDNNYQAWWQVDLQAPYLIDVVDIWNRTDCCGERLTDFDLLISTDGTTWTTFYHPGTVATSTSFVVNRVARYVKIQLRGSNFLALAEVQVWGPALPDLDVQGNSVTIANGDSTPSTADHTRFQTAVDGNVVRTFTIRNVGAAALNLSGNPLVSVTGNSAFTVSSQPASSSVAGGGSTTFAVTFAPSAVGVVTATVSIASNDPDENPYTFVVQGIRTGSNVALGQPATQSSTYVSGCSHSADKAVDGNTDGDWNSCSLSYTDNEAQAWWQVDLQAPYLIDMVDIWNRTDCCNTGLSNFDLLVSTDGTNWTSFYYPDTVTTSTSIVVNRVARYVKVQLRGSNYLGMAEVQVWGPAMTDLDVQGNSVSIANGDSSPAAADHTNFGRIDANGGSVVRTFTIRNVGAGVLTLSGSPLVSVTGDSAFTVSSQPASSSVAAGGSSTFQVTFAPSAAGMVTATVSIASNDPDENPYTFVVQGLRLGSNLAVGQPASQSSTYADACAVAAKAVDGNTDGNWSSCSVAHTNNDNQAWWQVDLQAPYLIDMVDIWNRTDCCGGGLSNFDLLLSTDGTTWTSFYYPDTVTTSASFVVNQVARYVKIQLRGANYLTLAEVQVWGPPLPEIDLQGNGVSIANGDSSPAAADHTDFGKAAVNIGTAVRTFTVRNTGAATLSLSGSPLVSISGNSAFGVTSQPAINSVAAGDSTTFEVTFAPSAAGVVTATVSIANDDGNENPYTFVLSGNGIVPNVEFQGVACDLIDAITAANTDAATGSCPAGSGADTITLLSDVTLTAVDNSNNSGINGLPQIGSVITMEGNGYIISRAANAPTFRFFYVDRSGILTLNRLTLHNGNGNSNMSSFGGAILNWGTVTVSNSTFTNNSGDGGAIYNVSTLTVNNSTFSGNTADYEGGAIHNVGTATVSNSTFSGNSAGLRGGAIYNTDSQTVTLVRSLISGNTAPDGAELYNEPSDPENDASGGTVNSNNYNLFGYAGSAGTSGFTPAGSDIVPTQALAQILDATLQVNGSGPATHALVAGSPAIDAAGDSGLDTDQRGVTRPQGAADDIGAFELEVAAPINARINGTDCNLIDAINAANSDSAKGACAAGSGADTITLLTDVTLTAGNNATNYGANGLPQITSAITLEGGGHTLSRADAAPLFRFFWVQASGTLTLNGLTLHNGRITDVEYELGGAIVNDGGTVTITNSTLRDNLAGSQGGAIFNDGGPLTITNSTLRDNTADAAGGAIFNDGPVTVRNSTFSGNSAGGGGAILNSDTLTVHSSTFSGNRATSYGGAIFTVGSLTLNRSLIAGNTASSGAEIYRQDGTITANNGNLIGYGGDARSYAFTPGATDIVPSGALATILNATLADNGGPSTGSGPATWTHALVTCSPALDAAGDSGFDTDQRGVTRPQGSADDIGAFELEGIGCAASEIDVRGNGVSIASGDTTPTTADHTDFGSVDVSSGTVVRTFTISNMGTAALTLSGSPLVALSGANAGDFTVTTQPANSVAANGSTTFVITFDPSAAGTRTATVTIANNDSSEGSYSFAVQGVGATKVTGQIGQLSFSKVSSTTTPDSTYPTKSTAGVLVARLSLKNNGGALNNVYFRVIVLNNNNWLLTADGAPGQVGSRVTVANSALPGGNNAWELNESFSQDFRVGMMVAASLQLKVDAYAATGVSAAGADGNGDELLGSYYIELDPTAPDGVHIIYLPAIRK